MDEYRGQEDASAEAHEPGHEVLHPLHPLLLQQSDQQQGCQAAAQLDEAKEDEDDDFCSDEIHPRNSIHFSPSLMGNRHSYFCISCIREISEKIILLMS